MSFVIDTFWCIVKYRQNFGLFQLFHKLLSVGLFVLALTSFMGSSIELIEMLHVIAMIYVQQKSSQDVKLRERSGQYWYTFSNKTVRHFRSNLLLTLLKSFEVG